jgi:hypothetical protein
MTHDQDNRIASADIRQLSSNDFAMWGVNAVAFVKTIEIEGQLVFAIHGADGHPLGVAPERHLAFSAVREHELEPLSVH